MNALEIISNIKSRTEVLQSLPLQTRIVVSSLIERYEAIRKQRLALVGKLYASRAKQKEDASLQFQQKEVRTKIEALIN